MRKIFAMLFHEARAPRNGADAVDEGRCPACPYKEALRHWLGEDENDQGFHSALLDEEAIGPRTFGF